MENELKQKRARIPRPDKFSLAPEAMSVFLPLLEQANNQLKGVKLTPNQFMTWYMSTQDNVLSKSQIEDLCATHFDEVKFGEWAVQELRESIKRGENKTLQQIIEENRPDIKMAPGNALSKLESRASKPRKKRAPKTAEDSPSEAQQIEVSENDSPSENSLIGEAT